MSLDLNEQNLELYGVEGQISTVAGEDNSDRTPIFESLTVIDY